MNNMVLGAIFLILIFVGIGFTLCTKRMDSFKKSCTLVDLAIGMYFLTNLLSIKSGGLYMTYLIVGGVMVLGFYVYYFHYFISSHRSEN